MARFHHVNLVRYIGCYHGESVRILGVIAMSEVQQNPANCTEDDYYQGIT